MTKSDYVTSLGLSAARARDLIPSLTDRQLRRIRKGLSPVRDEHFARVVAAHPVPEGVEIDDYNPVEDPTARRLADLERRVRLLELGAS